MNFQNENEKILYTMYLINFAEKETTNCYNEGLIPGTFHLCEGEEASHTGVCFAKKDGDLVLNTHRSHGEALGLGVSPKALFAEMFGRSDGISNGKGGSMHLSNPKNGYIGSNGIVGDNFSIGCGCALSLKMDKAKDKVVFIVTGDGALNEGSFHECFNMASIWNLPCVFVLVDNGYGVSTKAEDVSSCLKTQGNLKKRIESYNAEYFCCDGNDVTQVISCLKEAREVSADGVPSFVRLLTYRTSGHSKSDKNLYRTEEEISSWKKENPIIRFENCLLSSGEISNERLLTIKSLAENEIREAVEFAKNSPFPDC